MSKQDRAIIGGLALLGVLGLYLVWMPFFDLTLGFSKANKQANADGHIVQMNRDVRVRAERQLGWDNAMSNQGVNYGDELFVGEQSSALIRLNKLQVDVQANSLLSLQRSEGTASLELSRGSLSLDLKGDEKVNLTLAGKSLQVKGDDAKVNLSRDATGNSKSVGLSFVKGKANVTLMDPTSKLSEKERTLSGLEGGNYVVDVAEDGLKLKKIDLILKSPEDQATMLLQQKVDFQWEKLDSDIKSVYLDIAEDEDFLRPIYSQKVDTKKYNMSWELPAREGELYWRIHVVTKGEVTLKSASRKLQMVELRAMKIFNPVYSFKTPTKSNARLILESMSGASGYTLHVSTNPDFKGKVVQFKSKGTLVNVEVGTGAVLYVRAKPEYFKLTKAAPWSEVIELKIPDAPEPPSNILARGQGDGQALLTWSPVKDAKFYRAFIQIPGSKELAKDSSSTDMLVSCHEKLPGTIEMQSHALETVYSIRSKKVLLPACPRPLQITRGFRMPPYLTRHGQRAVPYLDLEWVGDDFAKAPILNISSTKDFAKNQNIEINMNGDTPLNLKGRVFARLRQDVKDPRIFIQWGPTFELKDHPIPQLKPTSLRLPASQEMILQFKDQAAEIELSWNPVEGALLYDVEISNSADFAKIIFKASPKTPFLQLSDKWPTGLFYWRVRAANLYRETEWTKPRAFRVVHGQ